MWILGFLGTSTGMLVGGIFAILLKKLHKKINNIYALCAGLILGLICIEIFPEAIEMGGWLISLIGLIIGALTFEYIHNKVHQKERIRIKPKRKVYNHAGFLIILSLSIHNLPMGVILGASQNDELRKVMLLTLFLHSIPEGIILFIPIILRSIKIVNWLFISCLISFPVVIGVFIGNFIGFEYKALLALIISFTAGNLLLVIVSELLFKALKDTSGLFIMLWFFIGFVAMGLYLQII